MQFTPGRVLKTYITLTVLSTLAASFIWGINTLFLLDAGLTITEAFAANAFFTLGMVIFEVPTGVVADTAGRRASYLLGTLTLLASTLFYLLLWQNGADFWLWALSSALLGLGFTFFSGATEAWLVDALHSTKYEGTLEAAFGKGQVASGIAMLTGAVAGGAVAQATNLGVPYILRIVMLGLTFVVASIYMKDIGFEPKKGQKVSKAVRTVLRSSLAHGLRNPPVKWVMLAGLVSGGVGIYAFYAMQPYLLELYARESYMIAGLAAAIVAGAQIFGGIIAPHVRRVFRRRTSVLLAAGLINAAVLTLVGLATSFWIVLVLLILWAMVFAAIRPVRQAYLNGLIPSSERATVLSSDSLLTSASGVFVQPSMGKVAEVWGYGASYIVLVAFEILALPFILLARREKPATDVIEQ